MIELSHIKKKFSSPSQEVKVLTGVDLKIKTNEFILIKGESGSGKSTLLFIMGGMLKPDAGKVVIKDKDLFTLSAKERTTFRAHEIGFVFQAYHLLPYLNVRDNIMLSDKLPGVNIRKEEVEAIAEELGLLDRLQHKPSEMSAGEKQRVALARAMVTRPSLILADEPTGNLDRASGNDVVEILEGLNSKGITLIMVTHDPELGMRARRRIKMVDGRIEEDTGETRHNRIPGDTSIPAEERQDADK